MSLFAQDSQRDGFADMLLNIRTDALYKSDVGFAGYGFTWLAAAARAKARLFGLHRQREEHHMLAPGTPRGAGWIAINLRGAYTVYKLAIMFDIFIEHCLPVGFIFHNQVHSLHCPRTNYTSHSNMIP